MAKSTPKEEPLIPPSVDVTSMDMIPKLGDAIKDMTLQLTAARVEVEKYRAAAEFWQQQYKELKDGSN